MTEPATAEMIREELRERRHEYSWHWLLSRLEDYVDIRGMTPEDEARLDGVMIRPVFMRDPRGEVGPDVDIMAMFRENAALWLSASPAAEHIVAVPRELLKAVLDCLPPDGSLAGMQMSVMEDMGKLLLERAASGNRGVREDKERHDGEEVKAIFDRIVAKCDGDNQ